jgi:hypothetical protein
MLALAAVPALYSTSQHIFAVGPRRFAYLHRALYVVR